MAAIASCSKSSVAASADFMITPGMDDVKDSHVSMMEAVFGSLRLSDAQVEAAFHAMEEYKYKTTCHAIAKASGKECGKTLKDGKCPTHKANIFPVVKVVVPKCDVEVKGDGENGLPKVCGKKCAEGSRFCAVHAKVRETPDGGCDHVFSKDEKKGQRCGKKCIEDSHLCKAHKAAADKAALKQEKKEKEQEEKKNKAAEASSSSSSSSDAKPVKSKSKKAADIVIDDEKLNMFVRVPEKYYLIKNTNLCVDHTKNTIIGYFENPEKGLKEEEYIIHREYTPIIGAYVKKFGPVYGLKTDLVEDDEEIEEVAEEEEEEEIELSASQ
jgi:hypothetical protein